MRNKSNVAQFKIDDRFTLSLSDVFTNGQKFEAVLIDNDSDETEERVEFIDLPEVWDFRDLKKTMRIAVDRINDIIAQEVLENTEFLEF